MSFSTIVERESEFLSHNITYLGSLIAELYCTWAINWREKSRFTMGNKEDRIRSNIHFLKCYCNTMKIMAGT